MEAIAQTLLSPESKMDRLSTDTVSSNMTDPISPATTKPSIFLTTISRFSKDGNKEQTPRSPSDSGCKDRKKWYHSLGSRRSMMTDSNDRDGAASPDVECPVPASPTPKKSFSRGVRSWRKRRQPGPTSDGADDSEAGGPGGGRVDSPEGLPGLERTTARPELPSILDRNNTFRTRTEQAFHDINVKYTADLTTFDTLDIVCDHISLAAPEEAKEHREETKSMPNNETRAKPSENPAPEQPKSLPLEQSSPECPAEVVIADTICEEPPAPPAVQSFDLAAEAASLNSYDSKCSSRARGGFDILEGPKTLQYPAVDGIGSFCLECATTEDAIRAHWWRSLSPNYHKAVIWDSRHSTFHILPRWAVVPSLRHFREMGEDGLAPVYMPLPSDTTRLGGVQPYPDAVKTDASLPNLLEGFSELMSKDGKEAEGKKDAAAAHGEQAGTGTAAEEHRWSSSTVYQQVGANGLPSSDGRQDLGDKESPADPDEGVDVDTSFNDLEMQSDLDLAVKLGGGQV